MNKGWSMDNKVKVLIIDDDEISADILSSLVNRKWFRHWDFQHEIFG
ncbi:MAG: hypothetical protein WCR55_00720 [Lentisphaerota bacterium]